MRRTAFAAAALVAAALASSAVAAPRSSADFKSPDKSKILIPKQEALLSDQARAAYTEALFYYDRANYEQMVRALGRAADEQPDFIDLQFLALANAVERAELTYSETSAEFYELADKLAKRLAVNQTLTPEQRARVTRFEVVVNGRPATTERAAVTGGRDGVLARDQKRLQTGLNLMNQIYDQRAEERGMFLARLGAAAGTGGTASITGRAGKAPVAPEDKKDGQSKNDPFKLLPGEFDAAAAPKSILGNLPIPGAAPGAGAPGGNPFAAPGAAAPAADGAPPNPFAQPAAPSDPMGEYGPPTTAPAGQ